MDFEGKIHPQASAPGLDPEATDLEKLVVSTPEEVAIEKVSLSNENAVDFEGPNDTQNPLAWSTAFKWGMIILISAITLVASFTTVGISPAAPQILSEFHSNSTLYATFLVSVWEMGLVFGPLVIGPASELYGRLPVYHVANVLFIIFSIACALSSNLQMLVAFRFLNGMSMASLTLNPGIAGDMFVQEERGGAIAAMSMFPLLGPLIGPIAGSYITQRVGWRWILWIAAILLGACEVCFLVLFRETYKPTILRRKAQKLRKVTGNHDIHSDFDTSTQGKNHIALSIIRPMKLLVFSPVLLILSLQVALAYGLIYLLLTTITEVFEEYYGFAQGPVGLTFLGIALGMTTGLLFCKATLDRYIKRKKTTEGGMKPEHRLPPMLIGSTLLPIGFFLYGWSVHARVQWMAPIIGTAFVGFGLMVIAITGSSYIVDAFGVYAASAIAATIVVRSLFGAVFPLVGPPLYARLGIGWGNTLLGLLALLSLLPPLFLSTYRERMRKHSAVTKTLAI